jgi:hypothetical protein
MAETKVQRLESLSRSLIAPGLRKRKRSETPPEQITSSDEARYTEQEERVARRMEDKDPDYF